MSDRTQHALGPHFWLNWQAQRIGQPARTNSRTHDILIQPLWQEYGLYSDARFTGELDFGPYRLLLAFAPRLAELGRAVLTLVLRTHDHLLDPSSEPLDRERQDVEGFAGGDLGDQLSSLLALALARRVRSGGVTRRAFEDAPEGKPFLGWHHPPVLVAPVGQAMVPSIADEASLDDARPYLDAYAELDGARAVVVQRAAHQYADALWWADADPRIAWIKLFGALEAAANQWAAELDPVEQLKRVNGPFYGELKRKAPAAIDIVARRLSRTLGAERKLLDFVVAHAPDPPQPRPQWGQVDWTDLEPVLRVLYDHRSRDLHGGIPFPDPLCEPPELDHNGIAAEAFAALAASSGGGTWPQERLPMYLHSFVSLVGGALRRWWLTLPEQGSSDP